MCLLHLVTAAPLPNILSDSHQVATRNTHRLAYVVLFRLELVKEKRRKLSRAGVEAHVG
jgi:hypothetical protein